MKRMIALILSLILLIGCGTVTVFADSGDTETEQTIAERIVEAANKRYYDPRHTITAEEINVFDVYEFRGSPAFAVYFSIKELGYPGVMLEERVGDWLLVSSHPEPFLFVNNKLYGFKEAYDAELMTDEMLAELAASDFNGGSRSPILTPYDESYILPEPTVHGYDDYKNGELYVSVRTEKTEDYHRIAKARMTVKELLTGFETKSVSLLLSCDTDTIFKVTLADKSLKNLWDAIAALEQDPAVYFAKPNHGEYAYCVPDDFVPGAVLVCGVGFEELLEDMDVTSVKALTSTLPNTIYKVMFAEQSTDIVWRALEILESDPMIIFAHLDYNTHPDNPEPVDPKPVSHTRELWENNAVPTSGDIEKAVNQYGGSYGEDTVTINHCYRFRCAPAYIVDFELKGGGCSSDVITEEYFFDDYLYYSCCSYEPSILIDDHLFTLSTAYRANILSDQMLEELVQANYICDAYGFKSRLIARNIKGDADGDGDVNIIDATCVQRHEAKITTASFFKPLADVNGDSEADVIDATLIQRSNAGMYTIE